MSFAPKSPKIYFAFPDGAYHYDCASCDALCCRGHGIGTAAREVPDLLARFPGLAWTATRTTDAGSDFTNPAGGCFFLTEKNLCQIERDHGRSAKPGVCVLFPFNDFSRVGDILVVRPHFLCPLRLAPGDGAGRHADLERLLHETGMLERASAQPGPDRSPQDALEMVSREEAFRDRCAEALGRGSFGELLHAASGNAVSFRRWRERAFPLWGLSTESHPRDELDDVLLALAPPLRVRLLSLSERRKVRVLSFAEAYLRRVSRIGSRPLTLQGAHHLIVNVLGVFRLLSRGNVPLRGAAAGDVEGVEFRNPRLTLAYFNVLEELRNGRRLYDVLEANLPAGLSEIERTLFLHQLAKKVPGTFFGTRRIPS